jgi:hypothetical protein
MPWLDPSGPGARRDDPEFLHLKQAFCLLPGDLSELTPRSPLQRLVESGNIFWSPRDELSADRALMSPPMIRSGTTMMLFFAIRGGPLDSRCLSPVRRARQGSSRRPSRNCVWCGLARILVGLDCQFAMCRQGAQACGALSRLLTLVFSPAAIPGAVWGHGYGPSRQVADTALDSFSGDRRSPAGRVARPASGCLLLASLAACS